MKEKCEILFKNLSLACLLLKSNDGDFFVRDVNEEYCKLLGKEREELLGLSISDVFRDKALQCQIIRSSLDQTLVTRRPVVFDYVGYDLPLEDYQGKESFWKITNIPIREDGQKDVQYILHLPWDHTSGVIEERKRVQLQRELDEKKAESECFIRDNCDGLFSLDRDGKFLSVNEGLIRLAELPESRLLQMSFIPFCAPHDRERIGVFFAGAVGGANQQFEADFVSATGRGVILDISLVPMKIDGETKGVYGIAKDITEKRFIESTVRIQKDELIRSEKKFRALVQEASDLMGILETDGTYKFVSESSVSVLGISPEDFLGKSAFDFIHPDDRERVISCFNLLQKEKQVHISPFRFQDNEGEWRWLETIATNLLRDPNVGGIVINSREVTESRRLLREIRDQNRILKEVAWEQAHVVRAPLARLKGLLDLLNSGAYGQWSHQELLTLISSSAEELDGIILRIIRRTERIETTEYE